MTLLIPMIGFPRLLCLLICLAAAAAIAQDRPLRGKVVYEGTYAGREAEGFLFLMGSDIEGAVTMTVEYDGPAVRATYKTTGKLPSGAVSGLIQGDVCKLTGSRNITIDGECTGTAFNATLVSQPRPERKTTVKMVMVLRVDTRVPATRVPAPTPAPATAPPQAPPQNAPYVAPVTPLYGSSPSPSPSPSPAEQVYIPHGIHTQDPSSYLAAGKCAGLLLTLSRMPNQQVDASSQLSTRFRLARESLAGLGLKRGLKIEQIIEDINGLAADISRKPIRDLESHNQLCKELGL